MPTFREFEGGQITYESKKVYTNDAAPFALLTIPLEVGEGGRIIADIVAMDDAGNRCMYYHFAPIKRALNGTVTVGTVNKLQNVEDTAMANCDVTIVAVGATVEVRVIGIAGKNIRWQMIPDINTTVYVP